MLLLGLNINGKAHTYKKNNVACKEGSDKNIFKLSQNGSTNFYLIFLNIRAN